MKRYTFGHFTSGIVEHVARFEALEMDLKIVTVNVTLNVKVIVSFIY